MHHVIRMSLFSAASAIGALSTAQCSRPSDVMLRCSAPDIRHILRVRATGQQVEDMSTVPVKLGTAQITASDYVLRFEDSRDHYVLLFRIDRASGRGTRQLFDDEQQAIRGHGGDDEIVCEPYVGVS